MFEVVNDLSQNNILLTTICVSVVAMGVIVPDIYKKHRARKALDRLAQNIVDNQSYTESFMSPE